MKEFVETVHLDINDISVIMPAKSVDYHLMRAIRSTLGALTEKSKILVFLDGCLDNSDELRGHFLGETRLMVYGSGKPIGISASLNKLIEQVSSPLIARMDADDICFRGRFSMQIRAMRKSGLDVVFSPVVLWRKLGILWLPFPQIPKALKPHQVALSLLFFNPLVHPTMLAKTEILQDCGGYRNRLKEDYDLWLRLSASGARIGRTALPGLFYRIHSGQTTASEDWRREAALEENSAEIDTLSRAVIPYESDHAERMKIASSQFQGQGVLLRLECAGVVKTLKRLLWARSSE